MTERAMPPSVVERLAFDAATNATKRAHKEFVRMCRAAGKEPRHMLASFDAEPWRWLFYFSPSDLVTDEMRRQPFPPEIRTRLDDTRKYVETPTWRRMFGRHT